MGNGSPIAVVRLALYDLKRKAAHSRSAFYEKQQALGLTEQMMTACVKSVPEVEPSA